MDPPIYPTKRGRFVIRNVPDIDPEQVEHSGKSPRSPASIRREDFRMQMPKTIREDIKNEEPVKPPELTREDSAYLRMANKNFDTESTAQGDDPKPTHHRAGSRAQEADLKPGHQRTGSKLQDPDLESSSFKSKSPTGAVHSTAQPKPDKDPEPHGTFHGAVVSSLNALEAAIPKPESVFPHLEDPNLLVPIEVFHTYNSVVSEKFSEMLRLHKDIMLEIIRKDEKRDEQTLLLCRENAELARQMIILEAENCHARDRVSRIKE